MAFTKMTKQVGSVHGQPLYLKEEQKEESSGWEVEKLAEKVHHLYCAQYQEDHGGAPYWTNGDYSKLDERTKEYDRNIARFMLSELHSRDTALLALIDGKGRKPAALNWSPEMRDNYFYNLALRDLKEAVREGIIKGV